MKFTLVNKMKNMIFFAFKIKYLFLKCDYICIFIFYGICACITNDLLYFFKEDSFFPCSVSNGEQT